MLRKLLRKNGQAADSRWVPGRTGTGLTDDINEVADWMQKDHITVFEHNYGLWYERRRDDHERIRRRLMGMFGRRFTSCLLPAAAAKKNWLMMV
jgi:hypothetical protein